jgi:hypothetical protein
VRNERIKTQSEIKKQQLFCADSLNFFAGTRFWLLNYALSRANGSAFTREMSRFKIFVGKPFYVAPFYFKLR